MFKERKGAKAAITGKLDHSNMKQLPRRKCPEEEESKPLSKRDSSDLHLVRGGFQEM